MQNHKYVPKYYESIGRSNWARRLGFGSNTLLVTNVAWLIDFHYNQRYRSIKDENVNRFKTLIDTMIDIVEKIEAYTPAV